jgi:hypothetical protein
VSIACQIRGRGELPVRTVPPLLGLHFDGDPTDTSGHDFGPYDWTFGDTLPSYPTSDPKFGSANVRMTPFDQILISDDRGALNLNEFGEWQVRLWVKPTVGALGYAGRSLLHLMHGGPNGSVLDGNASSAQLFLSVPNGGSGYGVLRVDYCADVVGIRSKTLPNVGAAVHIPHGEWTFVAVGGDATSTRAYVGGVLAQELAAPMFVSENFTHQYFVVGAGFVGGVVDESTFPLHSTWFNLWSGDIDDLCVSNGPGSFEFTGSSIEVPSGPFR